MNDKKLSGIERELVLQYLIDGNVPVTITPLENQYEAEKIHSLNSQVIPIAIRPEHLTVKDNGEIFLENPNQNLLELVNKKIKVEFYFNRVGLFFISTLKSTKKGIYLQLPKVIDRISDEEEEKEYDLTANIYYELKSKKNLNINSYPWDKIELYKRPVWKIIPLENQKKAKEILEKFVQLAKSEKNTVKNIGNGIQLISVCHFLTFKDDKMEALENRKKPVNILYIDHERIVLGLELNSSEEEKPFELDYEYGMKLSFSIKKGPIDTRDIFVTMFINQIYQEENKYCFDCKYKTMQEEDLRFLYEKTTSSLFI
ncbi:MAG: hypothetical protein K5866_04965 [Treponema sp.]|nr:hypothetical protein [Treponema sp.]